MPEIHNPNFIEVTEMGDAEKRYVLGSCNLREDEFTKSPTAQKWTKESLMGLVFREARDILIDNDFDPGTGYNVSSNGVVFHFVRGSTAIRIVVDGDADNYHSSNVSDVQIVPGA